MATCPPPSQSGCSNAFGTCSAGNSTYPPTGGADPSNNQTYAQDTSWPGLNTIFVSQTDTSSPSVLVNTLPSSTLVSSSSSSSSPHFVYKFSSQDPLGQATYATTCQDTFKPQFKASVDWSWTCSGCGDPGTGCEISYKDTNDILGLEVRYTTLVPNGNTQTPDADTNYGTSSIPNLFQFFYAGTCPANTYADTLQVSSLSTTTSTNTQATGNTVCSCTGINLPFPSVQGGCISDAQFEFESGSGAVYSEDNIGTTPVSYTAGAMTWESCTLKNAASCNNSNLGMVQALHAPFRDGLTRPTSSSRTNNCDNISCTALLTSTSHAKFYNYFRDDTSRNLKTIPPFPNMQHVSVDGDANTPSCKYMMDYCGNQTRGLFLNIQVPASSSTNINFSQTVQYGGKTYLKSFNIIGRFPGILTGLPSNPTATPEVVDLSTDVFYKLGAVLPGQAGYWNFGVQRFLGGIIAGSTYKTNQSKTCILDTTNKDFTNWPDITKVRQVGNSKLYEPDIVVRVVFFNPYLLDPTGMNPDDANSTNSNPRKPNTSTSTPFSLYVPTLVALDSTSITNFKTQALDVMTQNTPDLKSKNCDMLFVKAFERGVMMVEFVTTIAYSLMYGFALGDNMEGQPYFGVNQVYANTGPYSATNFLTHLYSYMPGVNIANANTPTLFNLKAESATSPQDEVTAWLAELQHNTSTYLSYPVFSWDATNEKLYVTLWMHPAMHAHLQGCLANTSYSMEALMGLVLRSFFKDITPGPSDLAAASIMGVASSTLTNSFTILTNNLTYTNSALSLSGAAQVPAKNLVLNSAKTLSPQRTFVASYAYTAQVTDLCAGSVFYMLGNSTAFGLDQAWPAIYATSKSGGVLTKLSVFAPTILASLPASSVVKDCLASKSTTSLCLSTLCTDSSHCLCDYSVWIAGLVPDPTPQVKAFVNNAWSTCSCLASDSYPRAYNTKRADNQVARAFAYACQGFPDPPYTQACDQLEQALTTKTTQPAEWYKLYSASASPTSPTQDFSGLTDAYKIVSVCNLQGIKPEGQFNNDVFKLNYKVLAASIVLCLAPIVGILAWCVYNKRRITNIKVVLGLSVLCLVVAGVASLLVYALSGQRSCAQVDLVESASASCVDRLSNKVVLSDNMCGQVRFCQCDVANQQCFKDAKVKNTATCTSEGVCSFCPNLTSFAVTTSVSNLTTCPTDLAYLSVAAWCFATSMLGTLWICLASSKRLSKLQTWSVFCALLVIMLGLAGLGVYLAIRSQKQTVSSIDLGQQAAAAEQDNPCGS